MTFKGDEVYNAGLALDVDERTLVAHRLLASLHSDDELSSQPDVDEAWRGEIDSRVDEVLNGTVELGSFDQTRANVRALLDSMRQ